MLAPSTWAQEAIAPTFTIDRNTITESETPEEFTVTIDQTNLPEARRITRAEITLEDFVSATKNTDFRLSGDGATDLNFTASDTDRSLTFSIEAIADNLHEGTSDSNGDEVIVVRATFTHNPPAVPAITSDIWITITDGDDVGVDLAATDITRNEGDQITYTVKLDKRPQSTLTVNITKSGTGNIDFASGQSSTLEFTNGNWSTAQTVTLTAPEDDTDATNEVITLRHHVNTMGMTTDVDLTVTATDNDGTPTLTMFTPSGGYEANESARSIEFTVNVSPTFREQITVEYHTAEAGGVGALATEDVDYTAIPDTARGTLTIASGTSTGRITVAITDDSITFEGDESFALRLTVPSSNAQIGTDNQADATINDDDSKAISLASTRSTTVQEADGSASIALSASLASGLVTATNVSVALVFSGTATEATGNLNEHFDFTPPSPSASITIPFGQAASTSAEFTISIENDDAYDGAENEMIDISGSYIFDGQTYNTGNTLAGLIAIVDDEEPPDQLTLAVSPASIDEAAAAAVTVTVTATIGRVDGQFLEYDADMPVLISVPAPSGGDYAAVTDRTLTIGPGATTNTVTFDITPIQDIHIEGAETISVSGTINDEAIIGVGGTPVTAETPLVINDDDRASVSITEVGSSTALGSLTLTEPVPPATGLSTTYEVGLGAMPAPGLTINVAAVGRLNLGGAATPVADCSVAETKVALSPVTLSFSSTDAGAKTVTATPCADADDAGDDEVVVSYEFQEGIVGDSAEVNMLVDDAQDQALQIAAEGTTVNERIGDLLFPVRLTLGFNRNVEVEYQVEESPGGVAAAGTNEGEGDFTAVRGTVTIMAYVNEANITIPIINDNDIEGAEVFRVLLSNPRVVGDSTRTVTFKDAATTHQVRIADDDANDFTMAISPTDGVDENGSVPVVLTVTPGKRDSGERRVNLTFSGTAVRGEDFMVANAIDIPANASAATATLTIVNDDLYDEDETIEIIGSIGSGSAAVMQTVMIDVRDDDDVPTMTLAVTPGDPDENAGLVQFNVTAQLDTAFDEVRTVQASVSADAAVAGAVEDFSFTIPVGRNRGAGLVAIELIDDAIDEEVAGTITVSGALTIAAPDTVLTAQTTVDVVDDDDSPEDIRLTGSIARLTENAGATEVTVTAEVLSDSTPPVTRAVATEVTVSIAGSGAANVVGFAAAPGEFIITIPPQTSSAEGVFTVTPEDDIVDADNETITLSGSVAATAEISVQPFDIELIDDDVTSGNVLLVADPLNVDEGADTATITVTARFPGLNPAALPDDLVIRVAVAGNTALSSTDFEPVGPAQIIIAAGATSGETTFELEPVDDNITEDGETITVSGDGFGVVVPATVTIVDNDEPGFDFPDGDNVGLNVTEQQGSATVGVRLATRPTADVTVHLSVSDADRAEVSPSSLIFRASNWDDAQAFAVSGLGDSDSDDHSLAIILDPDGNAAGYTDMPNEEVPLEVVDDDGVGLDIVVNGQSLDDEDALQVRVGEGVVATYGIRLRTQPAADVTVTMTPPGTHINVLEPSPCDPDCTFVFVPSGWQLAQIVRLEGIADDDGRDHAVVIGHALESDDEDYNDPLRDLDLTIVVDDDDDLGFVSTPDPVPGTEGQTTTYEVRLATKPFHPVTIALATSDSEKATVSPGALTFVPADTGENGWRVPQAVTVRSLDDRDAANENETITYTAESVDEDYDGRTFGVALVVTDDDTPSLRSVDIAPGTGPAAGGDTYGVGEQIELVARFSRAVRVTGNPRLRVQLGDEERFAEYQPPSPLGEGAPSSNGEGGPAEGGDGEGDGEGEGDGASERVRFAYLITKDDVDGDGITIPPDPLVLARGDRIVDAVSLDNDDQEVHAEIEVGDNFERGIPEDGGRVNGGTDRLLRAVAGEPQSVQEDETVTLDGSRSRAGEPDNIRYAWKPSEDNAKPVQLEGADQAITTFIAPNFKSTTTLTFILTVSNSRTGDDSPPGEVRVEVIADPDTPIAHAGEHQMVQENDAVTLDGSASRDPDGDDLAFAWVQDIEGDEPRVTLSDATAVKPSFTAPVNVLDGTNLQFVLTVTDADGDSASAQVTITVGIIDLSGVLGHAMSRFGRAVGSSAVDAVGERFGMAARRKGRTVSIGGTTLNLDEIGGGSRTEAQQDDASGADAPVASQPLFENHFGDRLQNGGRALEFNRAQLMQSSFEISVGDAVQQAQSEEERGAEWMLWGRADNRSFEAEPASATSVSGSVSIVYAGTDIDLDRQGILGLALSNASGDVDFTDNGLDGTISTNLFSIYPYGNWSLTDWLTGWAMFGVGGGEAEVTTDIGHQLTTDLATTMFAGGVRGNWRRWRDFDLVLKGDVLLLNSSTTELRRRLEGVDVSVQWARFGVEANRAWALGKSARIRPNIDLSGRFDGGDAETGLGVEMNLGTTYEHAMGLSVDVRLRYLLLHGESGSSESGASMAVHYAPRSDGGGLTASLAPTWGKMQSVAGALWGSDRPLLAGLSAPGGQAGFSGMGGQAAGDGRRSARMNAELGYGIMLRDWSITPYGTVNVAEASGGSQWGVRIRALELGAGELGLDLFGVRDGALPDRSVAVSPGLRAALRVPLPLSLSRSPSRPELHPRYPGRRVDAQNE